MAEITNETLKAFAAQMNGMTHQFLEMRESIKNIEDNICEVSVVNGGGLPVTIKTKDLLEKLHEYTRPDGNIDKKIKAQAETHAQNCAIHQKKFSDDLEKCRQNHSFVKRLGVFNKTGNAMVDSLKIIVFFLFILLSGWGWVESISQKKQNDKEKKELVTLNNKIQQLEKLIK